MYELTTTLALFLLLLAFQLLLSGIIFCTLTVKKYDWTFTDAYLVGVLLNAALGFLLAPILYDTFLISTSLKLATLALLVYAIYSHRKENLPFKIKQVTLSKLRKVQPITIVLGSTVTIIFLMFAATHSIGFDDISNLKYIYEIDDLNVPFPRLLDLIGNWKIARYPLWGIFMSTLSNGLTGGEILVYYLFSATLLAALIIKAFQLLQTARVTNANIALGIMLSVTILSVGGLDDYFNHGMYPLKQAKLLYVIGLLYLLIGWQVQKSLFCLVMGISLVSIATFYHLNLALLHAVIILLGIMYIFVRVQTMKKKFHCTLWLILPLLIGILLAIIPERGFLQFNPAEEKTEVIQNVKALENNLPKHYTAEEKTKASEDNLPKQSTKKHSMYERFLGQDSNYDYLHLKRAFSLEVILLPVILLIIIKINLTLYLSYSIIFITSLVLTLQLVKTLPKQAVASSLRSGTGWMLYDIFRYLDTSMNSKGRVFTDPYTAFYMKLLGKKNIVSLDKKEELLAFSPLFGIYGRTYSSSLINTKEHDTFLFNGRFWGSRAINQWGKDTQITVTKSNLKEKFDSFYMKGKTQELEDIIKNGISYSERQIMAPLLSSPVTHNPKKETYSLLYKTLPDDPIAIYKDSALITLYDLQPSEIIEMEIKGKGDIARYLAQFTPMREAHVLEYLPLKSKKRTTVFKVHHHAPEVKLLFKLDLGQLGGLGTFEKVTIKRTKNHQAQPSLQPTTTN